MKDYIVALSVSGWLRKTPQVFPFNVLLQSTSLFMVLSNAITDLEVVLVMNIMMVIRVLKSQRAGVLISVLS